jgi:hypothetical protein
MRSIVSGEEAEVAEVAGRRGGRAAGARSRGVASVARAALVIALALAAVSPLAAQRRRSLPPPPDKEPDFKQFNASYDGRITFVRLRFTPDETGWGGGGGFFGGVNYQWDHDYPRADRHFMTILSEITALGVRTDSSEILSANDPELFKYPVAYMCEPGHWTLTDTEAANLRSYLLKGGFIIFDDFAGGRAFEHFRLMLQKVLPDGRLLQLDATHPIFHSFFEIDTLDFRHPYYDVHAYFFGVFEDNDPSKRLLVIVNANNDIGESWEWSDTGFIPIDISNEAFKLGVNYIVYALTH